MTERAIEVGDLVQVVRGHLCDLGITYVVSRIEDDDSWHCKECGFAAHRTGENWAMRAGKFGAPLSWLKRIPPLSELETERIDDKVTA